MCSGLTLITKEGNHLFGRNMDIEFQFGQSVGIIPRNFAYKNMATKETIKTKFAIVAMMTVMENHPLLADGMNEKGLAIAGLNFPGYSYLEKEMSDNKFNIPCHDFMLWILSNFETLEEVKDALPKVNLLDVQINDKTPNPTLHYLISDKSGKSIVFEKTKEGMKIFDNPVGVLGNNPTFDWHLTNLRQYISIDTKQPENIKWSDLELKSLGQGSGGLGLPGDFSAPSRFVRIAAARHFAMENAKDSLTIADFFNILGHVAMIRGSVCTKGNLNDMTVYSSCMDLENSTYYYRTYDNPSLSAIKLNDSNLEGDSIKLFPYNNELTAKFEN